MVPRHFRYGQYFLWKPFAEKSQEFDQRGAEVLPGKNVMEPPDQRDGAEAGRKASIEVGFDRIGQDQLEMIPL